MCAAGGNEGFEGGSHRGTFGFRHIGHEAGSIFADFGAQRGDGNAPGLFKPDADAATVGGRDFAADEAASFEPFKQGRDRWAGDIEAVGKVRVAEALLVEEVVEEAQLGDCEAVAIPDKQTNGVEQCAGSEECSDCALRSRLSCGRPRICLWHLCLNPPSIGTHWNMVSSIASVCGKWCARYALAIALWGFSQSGRGIARGTV